jgi:hypothetical protein
LSGAATARTRAARVIAAAAFVSLALPASASADESPESLIAQGVQLRHKGQDAQAYGYFKRAYDLARTPRSAAQLALVEQAIADYWHAEKHFAEAMSSPDAWIRAQKKTLESARALARKHLAMLRLRGLPESGSVEVSTSEWPAEAVPRDNDGRVWLPEGTSTVKASAPSYRASSKTFTAAAGQELSWDLNLEPIAPDPVGRIADVDPKSPPRFAAQNSASNPASGTNPSPGPGPKGTDQGGNAVPPPPLADPAATTDSGRVLRYVGLGIAGAGVGATIAGFVVRSMALTKLHHIEDTTEKGGTYDTGDENWRSQEQLGVGLIIGGVATAAGGLVLYFVNRSSDTERTEAKAGMTFAFSPQPHGLGNFMLQGSF